MTRLIFTCLLLLISLMAFQYAIWMNTPEPESAQPEEPEVPVQRVNDAKVRQFYLLQQDLNGRLILVKNEVIFEI